ncbi:pyrroline-5-carboxylate reductase family protein [Ancylobacter defluvii]|uniref:Pyrroline-5-carboxylate reductase n=1 Tax=Ancylobacter defluvii TaxID=1282440 RepID=A0A9W6JVQ8_9HYPH|nr:pyrroline-5-carboxylate reductase dimerization domain-containing protein [Ancylobacter defluvii]MBS7590276.1 NAD(P)-binding domain-containing protein [Ancylobacter defluvii]GLK83189.1 pyrroline-5-carboxylate reductase [Ancylobacter defluvii]
MGGERLGLVGCGQLGGAIGRALLRSGAFAPAPLLICNRSGPAAGFSDVADIAWTTDPQEVADRCTVVLLALPPAAGRALRIRAPDRLVVSVMAGVTAAQLGGISGSARVVRGMSNPAAEIGMAYSPWFAAPGVTAADRATVRALFAACGSTDEVPDEGQIDVFTAITGPVPGFVAYFAQCVQDYAQGQGVEADVARRAVAQLFHAAGRMLAATDRPAADFVQEMIDYAGTTAAGLNAMKASPLAEAVATGLEAARRRCLTIGQPQG